MCKRLKQWRIHTCRMAQMSSDTRCKKRRPYIRSFRRLLLLRQRFRADDFFFFLCEFGHRGHLISPWWIYSSRELWKIQSRPESQPFLKILGFSWPVVYYVITKVSEGNTASIFTSRHEYGGSRFLRKFRNHIKVCHNPDDHGLNLNRKMGVQVFHRIWWEPKGVDDDNLEYRWYCWPHPV